MLNIGMKIRNHQVHAFSLHQLLLAIPRIEVWVPPLADVRMAEDAIAKPGLSKLLTMLC